jgi:hypothetical protein
LRTPPHGKAQKTTEIHPGDGVIVLVGVLREGLRDKDACIIDNRVNPFEPLHRGINDALADTGLGDIAGNREHHRVVTCGDIPRVGDHRVAEATVADD